MQPLICTGFLAAQVVVNLPDAAAQGTDMSFSGRHEHSRDGLDCVAIFDGVSWRLELVQGLVKGLKATRRVSFFSFLFLLLYLTTCSRLQVCLQTSFVWRLPHT